MNVRECYSEMGADFDDVLTRLNNERLVGRIAKKFVKDSSFADLREGLEKKDVDKAFRAAHTLKGICLNLGFSQMTQDVVDITEILRGKSFDGTQELFDKIAIAYQKTIETLDQLD